MMFIFIVALFALVFALGYWYRGFEHNIIVDDSDGEFLGS